MSANPSQGSRRCMRCLGALPDGVNFCVGCGFNNDFGTYSKMAGNVADTQKRQDRLRAWANSPRWLRWLIFWR